MSESRFRRRLVAGVAALALVAGGTVAAASSAFGAASVLGMSITSINPKKIAALSANQVVTITGVGFDESLIASVDLGVCTDAVYVVGSATTLYVKTPDALCGVATGGTAETITITDVDTNTLTFTGTSLTGLFFVAPPAIASGPDPVFTDLSANVDKYKKLKSTGGQTIRIMADSGYQFAGTTTGTLGGVALASIAVGGGAVNGNYITATAPAHAAGPVSLVLTAAGVAKTFSSATTGIVYWTPPTVTTITPNSGKAVAAAGSGGDVVIVGTGFSTTAASNTVTFCGAAGTVKTVPTPTATSITVTVPDPALGLNIYEGLCPVRVTVGGNMSPQTAASSFAYLIQ